MQSVINTLVKVAFTSNNLVTGLTTFTPVILVNGVVTSVTGITYTEVSGGLYTLNVTPAVSGNWSIFIEGKLYPLEVVARDTYTILRNIEDEGLGSWSWNKISKVLTAYRQDGTVLSTYLMTDTSDLASRERQ